jgi:HAD superfamily hydrolase (TIGR01509 family)
MLGRPAPTDLLPAYRVRIEAAFQASLSPVRGILYALDCITLPYCAASNGSPAKMRQSLGATGLLPRFEGRMFSAEQTSRPKPAPDVFLYAATSFGVSSGQCVVVEDTPVGIAAAVAAGMCALGYAGLTPSAILEAAGAHRTFQRMEDLPALLERIGRPPNKSSKPTPLRGAA